MSTKPWFQNPRDGQPPTPNPGARPAGMAAPAPASAASNAGAAGAAANAAPTATATPALAGTPAAMPAPASGEASPSQLIVGPKIRLNGAEIEQCDTLIIEGHVKATIKARTLRISASGTLDGDAEIEIAEIEGTFNGTINASTRLVVKSAGRVTGTIRYGRLVVDDGGELGGDVRPIGEGVPARANPAVRRDLPKEEPPVLTNPVPAMAQRV